MVHWPWRGRSRHGSLTLEGEGADMVHWPWRGEPTWFTGPRGEGADMVHWPWRGKEPTGFIGPGGGKSRYGSLALEREGAGMVHWPWRGRSRHGSLALEGRADMVHWP